jgi:hypothetical protein
MRPRSGRQPARRPALRKNRALHHEPDRDEPPAGVVTTPPIVNAVPQSQSLRLKMKYKLVHTIAIRTMAKGYPSTQCNSGISRKFIP